MEKKYERMLTDEELNRIEKERDEFIEKANMDAIHARGYSFVATFDLYVALDSELKEHYFFEGQELIKK